MLAYSGAGGGPGVAPPPPPPPPTSMGAGYAPAHSQQFRQNGQPPAPGGPPRPSGTSGHASQHGSHKHRPEPPPGFRNSHSAKPGMHRSSSGHGSAAPAPSNHAPSSSVIPLAAENRLRRDTPFLAHIRFRNDLPEIPSDPKMLVSQIQPEELSLFSLTSLERQARRDLLTPPCITISPLDVQRYQVPDNPGPMDPADAALLKDDARPLAVGGSPLPAAGNTRKSFAARTKGMDMEKCSWLMRTTYISSSDNRTIQRQGIPEKQALLARAQERRATQEDRELNDRDAQVAAIEASFEAARRPPVHSRNPALKPVEILPVLPDMDAWKHKLLLTTFQDADPADEVGAVLSPEVLSNVPAPRRPHYLVGHYLLKGFTHRTTRGGRDREMKIMALLVREDVDDMVARTVANAEQLQQQQQQEGGQAGVEGVPDIQPEDLEGDYQWTKDYNYDLKRDTTHYAVRLGKDAARFYRMQVGGGRGGGGEGGTGGCRGAGGGGGGRQRQGWSGGAQRWAYALCLSTGITTRVLG